jgi:hypothetical protein
VIALPQKSKRRTEWFSGLSKILCKTQRGIRETRHQPTPSQYVRHLVLIGFG